MCTDDDGMVYDTGIRFYCFPAHTNKNIFFFRWESYREWVRKSSPVAKREREREEKRADINRRKHCRRRRVVVIPKSDAACARLCGCVRFRIMFCSVWRWPSLRECDAAGLAWLIPTWVACFLCFFFFDFLAIFILFFLPVWQKERGGDGCKGEADRAEIKQPFLCVCVCKKEGVGKVIWISVCWWGVGRTEA